jgi:hypothetical protein
MVNPTTADLIDVSPKIFRLNDSTNARIEVTTSGKYDALLIDSQFNSRVAKGYTQNSKDWRNTEATVRFKVIGGTASDFVEFWFRTGKDTAACICEGFAYRAGIRLDGLQSRVTKQMYRGLRYNTTRTQSLGSLIGKWVLLKAVCIDLDVNGEPTNDRTKAAKILTSVYAAIEGKNNGNMFELQSRLDDVNWGMYGDTCGGGQTQVGLWGAPIVALTYNAQDLHFTQLAVQEIDPTVDYPVQQPGGDNPPSEGGTEATILYQSTSWANGTTRTLNENGEIDPYDSRLEVRGSSPSLVIDGQAKGFMSGNATVATFHVNNYDASIECYYTPNSSLTSLALRVRSRRDEGGSNFGGYLATISLSSVSFQRETTPGVYASLSPASVSISPALVNGTRYRVRFTAWDDGTGDVDVKLEIDRGQGYNTAGEATDATPPASATVKATYIGAGDLSYSSILVNGTSVSNVEIRDVIIRDATQFTSTQCPAGQHWDTTLQKCVQDATPPPPPPPASGQVDSNGIKWLYATGEAHTISQSRDDGSTDDRWSQNFDNIYGGYEMTLIGTFSGVASGGHCAAKLWGGNHSGSGTSDNRWYDLGIRADGAIQTEWEGPHPSNHDFTPGSGEQKMTNVGVEMDGHSIGIKWVVYPIKEGGQANDGGIKLLMWVDPDALLPDGKPRNDWRLALDITDTGQIIDPSDYRADTTQELEVRNSDTDEQTFYGGGVHMRYIRRPGDITTPGGGGGGGGGGTTPTCPAGQHWDASLGQCVVDTPSGGGGGSGTVSRVYNSYDHLWNTLIEPSGFVCSGQPPPGGGGEPEPYELIYDITTITDDKQMAQDYSGEDDRAGVVLQCYSTSSALINVIPRKIGVYLKKVGSPTGTLYVEIRDGTVDNYSRGNIKVLYGTIDVSTLTTSYPAAASPYEFTNDLADESLPNGMQHYYKLGVRYEGVGSNSSNYVVIGVSYDNPYDGTYTNMCQWEKDSDDVYFYNVYTGRDICAKIWI